MGKVVKAVDPLGRETHYIYGSHNSTTGLDEPDAQPCLTSSTLCTGSGMDLLEVRQVNSAAGLGYDVLASYTYNDSHQMVTATGAAGQTTMYTYNESGQLEALTDSLGRTTTHSYDPYGRLTEVAGAVPGWRTEVEYDAFGRASRLVGPDGYALTREFDALDRPTRITFPDGTYNETVYDRLDVRRRRDSLGRWTQVFHDPLRRVAVVRDPLGRTTTWEWCACGNLERFTDANGNPTEWEVDLQGRVIREIRANGTSIRNIFEDTTSRLKQVLGPGEHLAKSLEYYADDSLKQVSYDGSTPATPTVSYTYDPAYPRLSTMSDGIGTTVRDYYPITVPATPGAGMLRSIDGPYDADTVEYTYDALGRVESRRVDGVTDIHVQGYDSLGRIEGEENPLGVFSYHYQGVTRRLDGITYPNGQTVSLSYFDLPADRRAREILYARPDESTVAAYEYTYDNIGNVKTWTLSDGEEAARTYHYEYDQANRLTAAVLTGSEPEPQTLRRYHYGYDPAGNRTGRQTDDVVMTASFNNMNQMTSIEPGGELEFRGSLSEPATVDVLGNQAEVTPDNRFSGRATVHSGSNTVALTATDASGNSSTNTYEVPAGGSATSLTYDPAGRLTSDGTRAFEWDAESRLVAVSDGPQRSEFHYDGAGRLARIVEYVDSAIVSDHYYVWCSGARPCQERAAGTQAVTQRFYQHGVVRGEEPLFFVQDALGSVRALTDWSASVVARYDYSPYGVTTLSEGVQDVPVGFAGMWSHRTSGLLLARYRAYDPERARWLATDPIGLKGGANLYAYADGDPINRKDPLGLAPCGGPKEGYYVVETGEFTTVTCPKVSTPNGDVTGSVCCLNGERVLCISQDWWDSASALARKCVQSHEASHAGEQSFCKPKCTGGPCEAQPSPFTHRGHACSECLAWLDTYMCFKGSGEVDPRPGSGGRTYFEVARDTAIPVYCMFGCAGHDIPPPR